MIPTIKSLLGNWKNVAGLALLGFGVAQAQFAVGGDPRVNPNDFVVTTFATGLNYPVGMALLPDSSIVVAVSTGTAYFSTTSGRLLRLVDTSGDGVADQQNILVNNVPGGMLTTVRIAGNLLFTTGQGKPITIYRFGSTLSDTMKEVGRIVINYTGSWEHQHSALCVRPTPASTKSYDLFFQLGSEANFAKTTRTLSLTSTIGLSGTLNGDALYMLRITDSGDSISASALTQVATGLRNAAGMAFHPVTGDLYFEDNGIDGLVDPNEPLSADELNVIPANKIGGDIEDFGFPNNYIKYRTGEFIGGNGIKPLIAFEPIPDPMTGSESEGANDITFAPAGFPAGMRSGLFIGFHGRFSLGGISNEENPMLYVDLDSLKYFDYVGNNESAIGHLDGQLAVKNLLYVSDISPGGAFGTGTANKGITYLIKAKQSLTSVVDGLQPIPSGYHLSDAYPNPFNLATTIRFDIPGSGVTVRAILTLYNTLGQDVVTLFDKEVAPGEVHVKWDGKDKSGKVVPTGVYIYRLSVGGRFVEAKKTILMK